MLEELFEDALWQTSPAGVERQDDETWSELVEDPSPRVNYEIACWIQQGDLVLRGVNVSERLAERRGDLLLVVANRDGIVPAATARSAMNVWGGSTDVLEIGNDQRWYSHADLFVGRDAVEDVFDPLAAWLRSRNVG